MKKYSKLIVAAIVALIFVGTFVFLYQKSQPKATEYSEFVPKMGDVLKTTVITGKIEPRNEVSVKPQISGIITEICKEAGDYVQAGEVIAKVKVIPDMGQLSSAQARVRLAEINLKQAQVDFGREDNLYKKQLVSADEFDKVKQALKQAREEKVAAEDALEVVRDGVSKSNANASSTLIRSTISGIILDIPVKVGNSVILSNTFNDGTTIASVANMNDLIFRGTSAFSVPKRRMTKKPKNRMGIYRMAGSIYFGCRKLIFSVSFIFVYLMWCITVDVFPFRHTLLFGHMMTLKMKFLLLPFNGTGRLRSVLDCLCHSIQA